MDKSQVRYRIEEIGIVPAVRVSSTEDARFAAEAVALGGIPIVEITMTVPGAIHLIADFGETRSGYDCRRRKRNGRGDCAEMSGCRSKISDHGWSGSERGRIRREGESRRFPRRVDADRSDHRLEGRL